MAFLIIALVAVIATWIMESEFMNRMEDKAEINRMADSSLKKSVAIQTRRCVYSKAYKPVLKKEGEKK